MFVMDRLLPLGPPPRNPAPGAPDFTETTSNVGFLASGVWDKRGTTANAKAAIKETDFPILGMSIDSWLSIDTEFSDSVANLILTLQG
jgi:hypothetical protein